MKRVDEMSRDELTAEFHAFLAEARRRGDTRNGTSLIAQWYEFRRTALPPPPVSPHQP